MTGITGNEGTVLVGSTNYNVTSFNISHKVETADTTTTADLGYRDKTPVAESWEGSFDFLWNPNLAWIGGKTTVNLTLTPVGANTPFKGNAILNNVDFKSAVAEIITLTAQFESKGQWQLPT